jgi:8-oxo-dGTP pyrophosphatase MutT (NUDIX family)
MKKRGFGEGKCNGVGGKIEIGESIEEAAVREAQEEIGVDIQIHNLESVGQIVFTFDQNPEWDIYCHVFLTTKWSGSPTETEEMAPQWFKVAEIPYDKMWVDDKYWLPLILEHKKIKASFHFTKDGSEILNQLVETY